MRVSIWEVVDGEMEVDRDAERREKPEGEDVSIWCLLSPN